MPSGETQLYSNFCNRLARGGAGALGLGRARALTSGTLPSQSRSDCQAPMDDVWFRLALFAEVDDAVRAGARLERYRRGTRDYDDLNVAIVRAIQGDIFTWHLCWWRRDGKRAWDRS